MMKKFMIAGMMAATALTATTPATAQMGGDPSGRWQRGGREQGSDDGQRIDRRDGWRVQQGERAAQAPSAPPPPQQPARTVAPERWRGADNNNNNGAWQRRDVPVAAPKALPSARWQPRDDRRDDRHDWRDDRRDDRRDWRDDRRDDRKEQARWHGNSQHNNWNRDWRRDNRYDWQSYRNQYRNVYRPGRYYAPSGWGHGYRGVSIGIYLGSGFYNDRYWIDDPWRYRLPPAYGAMRWVRYYDDALLVDIRNGYVVDVIRDFFW